MNYLAVLVHWTKTFSYDFRTATLMSQLEAVTNQIIKIDPLFKPNVKLLLSDIMAKVVLDDLSHHLSSLRSVEYSRPIRTIFTISGEWNSQSVDHLGTDSKSIYYSCGMESLIFQTDIYEQCPCPKEFAHQLTHIELVRSTMSSLWPKIGFLFQDRLKAIGAEEFIHMRSSDSAPKSESDSTKSSAQAWTSCLEAYINWSNRLSSFVTTEVIKHLKRHIRVKLLNYFIDAALECFNTGNFNSMMGILGNDQHGKSVRRRRLTLAFSVLFFSPVKSRWPEYVTNQTLEENGMSPPVELPAKGHRRCFCISVEQSESSKTRYLGEIHESK